MANQKITEVGEVNSLNFRDNIFVNSSNTLRQMPLSDIFANHGGVSMEVLWENPNPAAEFAAQDITLSNTANLYIFTFTIYKNEYDCGIDTVCSDLCIGGRPTMVSEAGTASNNFYTRNFSGSGTTVSFSDCHRKAMSSTSAGSVYNDYIIPTKIIGLSFGLNNFGITDYIVEQGENENWAWKKWNSGVAELYGYGTITGTSPSSLMSGFYSYGNTPAYPFSLTDVAFSANSNAKLGTGLGWSNIAADKNFATIYCVGNQSSNQITYTCMIRGRWK